MHDLIRSLTELECLVADLTSSTESTAERQEALEGEVATIESRIEAVRAELEDEIQPAWRAAVAEERTVRQELDGESARVDALYAKQGRHGQFATRAERDVFLAAQASTLESRSAEAVQKAEALGARADDSRKRLEDVQDESRSLRTAIEGTQAEERTIADDLRAAKDKEGQLSDERKDLWREDAKVESTAHHAREELKGAERHLATMMDRDTASGLKALDRIVDRLGLDGVYGPLYKLFTVSEKYSLAVEETAGTSLFHVVVDTDTTASRLVEVMNAERLGRLTFVPLNRVRATPHTYPQSDEVIPLIRKLQYDALHAPAFEQVRRHSLLPDIPCCRADRHAALPFPPLARSLARPSSPTTFTSRPLTVGRTASTSSHSRAIGPTARVRSPAATTTSGARGSRPSRLSELGGPSTRPMQLDLSKSDGPSTASTRT
jgi:structural maintenance of chromosome 3 (chondroitin sulfate proteoglycan 6)